MLFLNLFIITGALFRHQWRLTVVVLFDPEYDENKIWLTDDNLKHKKTHDHDVRFLLAVTRYEEGTWLSIDEQIYKVLETDRDEEVILSDIQSQMPNNETVFFNKTHQDAKAEFVLSYKGDKRDVSVRWWDRHVNKDPIPWLVECQKKQLMVIHLDSSSRGNKEHHQKCFTYKEYFGLASPEAVPASPEAVPAPEEAKEAAHKPSQSRTGRYVDKLFSDRDERHKNPETEKIYADAAKKAMGSK